MPSLGTSFGRGGATTFQQDLQNSDCILIMGSNMAECHPVGFQWVMEAKLRGATVIHVDPRFSRTSAVADVFVPIRAGSDIAFLGAVVNHILENGREFRDYVVAYTNASAILSEEFRDTEDLDGLFSGWDPETCSYDNASWQYAGQAPAAADAGGLERVASQGQQHGAHGASVGGKPAQTDPTLEHPRCVFQVLKRHFRRYTPELVEEVCGVPREQFLGVAEGLCRNSGPERTSAFCYAVGWTQHTVGVQYIRTAAIIQLLLGNIGRPGGGILALRGHASIQGSTDIPTLYDLLPGYLAMPHAELHADLAAYLQARRKTAGAWAHVDAYLVSLLKAWWGDNATVDNDFCFDHLPRISGDHSAYQHMLGMLDGSVKGYFLFGQNPAVGSSNSRMHRLALAELDWLVVATWSRSRAPPSGSTAPRSKPASWSPPVSAPKCSSSPRPPTPRRTARSRTPSGSSSGTTRRSSRPATAAPTCGSPTTWAASSGRSWLPRPTPGTVPSWS